MDFFWIFVTNYGNLILWLFSLSLVVLEIRKDRKEGLKLGLLLLLTVILRTIILYSIRFLYPTQRPFEVSGMTPLVMQDPGGSFPSGHASTAFVLASLIFTRNKKLGIISFILASLVAYSRVYVGVHYPVDIIVGSMVGVLSLIISKLLMIKPLK